MDKTTDRLPNGPAAAALVSAGVGCFVTGLMTTGAEASAGLKTALTWSDSVGPLSGKTLVGVFAWLIVWVILHLMWKDNDVKFRTMFYVTLVLIAAGFLMTFPVFFAAFAAE